MIGNNEYRALSLPGGLSTRACGGELAEQVAEVAPEMVSGFDTIELARAAYRQATHSRALFLRAVAESGMREPGSVETVERVEHPSEFSSDEIRAALVWSRTRAENTFWLGHSLFVTFPMLGAAMLAGVLDEPRAKAFVEWTSGLSDEHAQRVCDELVGAAPTLLVGQLIDAIKRLAIALDPDWAQRRYDEAVTVRRVESWQNPDGTANVAGRDLPTDRAVAGVTRIDALARSVKNAGDGRPMDAIRADLFVGMLDGQFTGMTDDEIVDYILNNPLADGPVVSAPRESSGDEVDSETVEHARGGDTRGQPEQRGGDQPEQPGQPAQPEQPEQPEQPVRPRESGRRAGTGSWNVGELRIGLCTALGLNQHPGELPGFGFIPAGVAISLLAQMGHAEWRFVVCDAHGSPICSGITGTRPQLGVAAFPPLSGRGNGIVEFHVSLTQLRVLRRAVAHGRHPDWAPVIKNIAERCDAGMLDYHTGALGDAGGDERDLRRRLARAGLRRWVEVRDRYCRHPACRMPARRTDQNHRRAYAAGGLTDEENLESVCRHDHRLIHEGGWITIRTGPNQICWISGLGRRYITRPPPVMILPDTTRD